MARVKTRVKNQSAACGKFFKDLSTQNVNIICDHVFPKPQALDPDAHDRDNLLMLFAGLDRLRSERQNYWVGVLARWALDLGGWVKANNNAFLIRNFSRSSSSPSQFW